MLMGWKDIIWYLRLVNRWFLYRNSQKPVIIREMLMACKRKSSVDAQGQNKFVKKAFTVNTATKLLCWYS